MRYLNLIKSWSGLGMCANRSVALKVGVMAFLVVCDCRAQNLRSGGHGTSGGGGVRMPQGVVTFLHAEQVQAQKVRIQELKAFRDLEAFLNSNVIFSQANRSRMLQALVPDDQRKYYSISKADVDPEVYRGIAQEYAELKGFPIDQIVLYALTDKKEKQTFFLPEFFELSTHEQTAIIFHEMLWLILPDLSYAEMVQIENDFQLSLIDHDIDGQIRMADRFGSMSQRAFLRYHKDQRKGLISNRKSVVIIDELSYYLSPEFFLGDAYLNCRRDQMTHDACLVLQVAYAKSMIQKVHKSAFLKFLFESLASGQFDCVFWDPKNAPARLTQNSLSVLRDGSFVRTDFEFSNETHSVESSIRFVQSETKREMVWIF